MNGPGGVFGRILDMQGIKVAVDNLKDYGGGGESSSGRGTHFRNKTNGPIGEDRDRRGELVELAERSGPRRPPANLEHALGGDALPGCQDICSGHIDSAPVWA